MGKVKDLRRNVSVAKMQVLIDAVIALDANTDEIEAKLQEMIVLLTSLDGKDYATETTLLLIEETVNAIETILTSLDGKDFSTQTTLALVLTELNTLNTVDFATEVTQTGIKAQTDKLTFTGGDLNVNASVSPAVGVKRPITIVQSLVDGSTTDDVQSLSIWFDGKNGTLNGVAVIDGYVASFSPNGGSDTIGSIAYTVPDTKGLRVVINYVLKA